jgi:hypothetical protein
VRTFTRDPIPTTLDCLAVWPHHPDRFRRPACRPDRLRADLATHGLTWNLFRTFELLPPAFWLRRFHARMQNADTLGRAPVTARISLWCNLPPSPQQAVGPCPVVADVVIETEHAVWTLMTTYGADIAWSDMHEANLDPVGRMIDAGVWLAGRRDYFCGLIVRDTSEAPLGLSLMKRYARSERASRAGVRGMGVATWSSVAEILDDCIAAEALSPVDQSIARSAQSWITRSHPDVRLTSLDVEAASSL